MKIITISKIGYNHPSKANWSYGIWKVDTIDTIKEKNNRYAMSYTVKETFGGDSRLKKIYPQIIETEGVYPLQKVVGIKSMIDMESKEMLAIIKDFLAKK